MDAARAEAMRAAVREELDAALASTRERMPRQKVLAFGGVWMYVALSYDHHLIEGEQAVTFLVRVKERLEDLVRMLLEA